MKIEDIYLILFVSILPYIFASDFFKRKIKSRLFSKLLLNCDFFLIFFYNQRAKGPNTNQISKQQKLQTRRWLIKHHKIYLNVMHSIIQSISTHIGFLVYMNHTSPIEIPINFLIAIISLQLLEFPTWLPLILITTAPNQFAAPL